jgi:hypothetical protein
MRLDSVLIDHRNDCGTFVEGVVFAQAQNDRKETDVTSSVVVWSQGTLAQSSRHPVW